LHACIHMYMPCMATHTGAHTHTDIQTCTHASIHTGDKPLHANSRLTADIVSNLIALRHGRSITQQQSHFLALNPLQPAVPCPHCSQQRLPPQACAHACDMYTKVHTNIYTTYRHTRCFMFGMNIHHHVHTFQTAYTESGNNVLEHALPKRSVYCHLRHQYTCT
jgi:hypothetical protein